MRIPFVEPYKETATEEEMYLPKCSDERETICLVTDDDKSRFIKSVEKMVRWSFEYREYISYLVNAQEMNICSAFQNISRDTARNIRIEIHHEPFTLYDIVYIVYLRFLRLGKEINPYDIAEEVLSIHFRGMVGLVPLSKTVHELLHVGKVFIPVQFIGDGFMKFYAEYKEDIPDNIKQVLEKKIELSKTFNFKSNTVLQKKYIYIKNEGYDNIPEQLPSSKSK